MPKKKIPGYLKHKSGQARVIIHGKTIYLGLYGTPESFEKYDTVIAEYLANGKQAPPMRTNKEFSIEELAVLFMQHAERHYRKHGRPTQTDERYRLSLAPVVKYYGKEPISAFGPLALQFIRQKMIEEKTLCRTTINARIDCIRNVFRWAISQEMCAPSVLEALQSVQSLEKGRTEAPEREPVKPVPFDVVAKTLPYLKPIVRDMVRLQLLSACRPAEVCLIRNRDIDQLHFGVWIYDTSEHKTEHKGKTRKILLGPESQTILLPHTIYKNDNPFAYLFSPKDTVKMINEEKRRRRKTKVQPSQQNRSKKIPKRTPGERYTTASYRRAIHRACDDAGIDRWSPNRLRHTKATQIRSLYGVEVAQALLGHSCISTTELYAEKQLEKAKQAAEKHG